MGHNPMNSQISAWVFISYRYSCVCGSSSITLGIIVVLGLQGLRPSSPLGFVGSCATFWASLASSPTRSLFSWLLSWFFSDLDPEVLVNGSLKPTPREPFPLSTTTCLYDGVPLPPPLVTILYVVETATVKPYLAVSSEQEEVNTLFYLYLVFSIL
jgi:hypothetical protein